MVTCVRDERNVKLTKVFYFNNSQGGNTSKKNRMNGHHAITFQACMFEFLRICRKCVRYITKENVILTALIPDHCCEICSTMATNRGMRSSLRLSRSRNRNSSETLRLSRTSCCISSISSKKSALCRRCLRAVVNM